MKRNNKELELYIHIPFCVRKCAYCDFLSFASDEETIEAYVSALVNEILSYQKNRTFHDSYKVSSVFLGGGTPSLLIERQIADIFEALKKSFSILPDAEITIEANPGTVSASKLQTYRTCGINRISFGLQSTDNESLKLLGRIHTYDEFLESYQLARDCGFDNINVDLISAIPRQTLSDWEDTLREVVALQPEHISAYSLIVEEGTPFAKCYGEGCSKEKELPDEDTERLIYQRTEGILKAAGYARYEISNYAKMGYECKHNLGYWERTEYLGLGLGAASLIQDTRFHNTEDMERYLANCSNPNTIQCERTILTQKEQMEEFFFLGLRKMVGVSLQEFEETYGKDNLNLYRDKIEELKHKELLEESKGYLRLTKHGIDISNYVFGELLYD